MKYENIGGKIMDELVHKILIVNKKDYETIVKMAKSRGTNRTKLIRFAIDEYLNDKKRNPYE